MNISQKRKRRREILDSRGRKCQRCSWDKINPTTGKCPVEVDHIDGNRDNNSDENLIVLCPNCHSLTPTYKYNNRKHTPSTREKIGKSVSIVNKGHPSLKGRVPSNKGSWKHGTLTSYCTKACRCIDCKQFITTYNKKKWVRRKSGELTRTAPSTALKAAGI